MSTHDLLRNLGVARPTVDTADGGGEVRRPLAAGPRDLLACLDRVPLETIPALLGDLEQLKAALWVRLNEARPTEREFFDRPGDGSHSYLKPEEVARALGVSVRWLYRHHRQLPFAHKLSRKTLRFSESGLRRWQARRKA
jgi:predicted DNA-binding transcriptional regulator AlpA